MNRTAMRTADLRQMLTTRQRDMRDDVQVRMRDERTGRPSEVRDDIETADAGIQEDLGFALLQMRAETLKRIDEAIGRLDAGEYGCCVACAGEIPEQRLRALPFAVRCQPCEEMCERQERVSRRIGSRQSLALFPEASAP